MKKLTIEEFGKHVEGSLAEAQQEHVMVTRDGRPVAVLLGIEFKDEEDWRLEVSPGFWREIEEARREQSTIPWEEVKAGVLARCDILKFTGTTSWSDGDDHFVQADVSRALLRNDDELVFQFEYQGWHYNALLRRKEGSLFEGEFDGQKGKWTSPVKATGMLYMNECGYLISGSWLEDGSDFKWWAELESVESFADEKQEVGRNEDRAMGEIGETYSVEFALNVKDRGLVALCCFPDPKQAMIRAGDPLEFIQPNGSIFLTRVGIVMDHRQGLIGLFLPDSVQKDDIPLGTRVRLLKASEP